jgi:hypothetical protein
LPNERFEKLADDDGPHLDLNVRMVCIYRSMTIPKSNHQPQRSTKECLISVIDE